jgi:hypothetical protein
MSTAAPAVNRSCALPPVSARCPRPLPGPRPATASPTASGPRPGRPARPPRRPPRPAPSRAPSIWRQSDTAEPAYNLTVAGIRTYYVLAGDTPVLVHNSCGPDLVVDPGALGRSGESMRKTMVILLMMHPDALGTSNGSATFMPDHMRLESEELARTDQPTSLCIAKAVTLLITKADGTFVSLYPGANTSPWWAGTPMPCGCSG